MIKRLTNSVNYILLATALGYGSLRPASAAEPISAKDSGRSKVETISNLSPKEQLNLLINQARNQKLNLDYNACLKHPNPWLVNIVLRLALKGELTTEEVANELALSHKRFSDIAAKDLLSVNIVWVALLLHTNDRNHNRNSDPNLTEVFRLHSQAETSKAMNALNSVLKERALN